MSPWPFDAWSSAGSGPLLRGRTSCGAVCRSSRATLTGPPGSGDDDRTRRRLACPRPLGAPWASGTGPRRHARPRGGGDRRIVRGARGHAQPTLRIPAQPPRPVSFAPCVCPTCSSPRCATIPPRPRCRPTACCCGPATCASWVPGIYSLLPLGLPRQQAGGAGHPRGAQRDRRPGDGDAGRPPGGPVARDRPLRRHRAGDGALQGPRGPGHGPGDDARGGRRRPAARHRPQLPPAAVHHLPLPDQVPRRAPVARRPDPRARVRHEGQLHLRSRRGRAWTSPTGRIIGPTPGSSSAWASRPSPSRPTRG